MTAEIYNLPIGFDDPDGYAVSGDKIAAWRKNHNRPATNDLWERAEHSVPTCEGDCWAFCPCTCHDCDEEG